jgi:hypothetical protein
MLGQQLAQVCTRCARKAPYRLRNGVCHRCHRDADWTRQLGSNRIKRPLPQPTMALPGTKAKMDVLAERLRLGQELWHQQDATWDDLPADYLESLLSL